MKEKETPDPEDWNPVEAPPDMARRGFYVGTSGYYFDDWIGRFNPPRPAARERGRLSPGAQADQDRLRFYQKYFRFVEINSSFYTEPLLSTYAEIEKRSRPDMMYAVKANRDVSHTREWDAARGKAIMERHVEAVSPLVETGRFYSFLIQLEDRNERSAGRLDYLLRVCEPAIRRKIDAHIEFRHASWHREQVLQALKDNGVGVCNTEIPPVPHAFPLKSYATTPKGYLRYSGLNLENWYPRGRALTARERTDQRNRRYDYLYSEEEIKERVEGQLRLAAKTGMVAVAYNNHFKISAVLNAIFNLKWLEWKLGRAVAE